MLVPQAGGRLVCIVCGSQSQVTACLAATACCKSGTGRGMTPRRLSLRRAR